MPLVLDPRGVTKNGALIPRELRGATYKDFTCCRCSTTYQRMKAEGATEFSERPCPNCGCLAVQARYIPTGKRVPESDISPERTGGTR